MGWLNAIIKTESDAKGWQNFWPVHLVLDRWRRNKNTAVNTAFSLEKNKTCKEKVQYCRNVVDTTNQFL